MKRPKRILVVGNTTLDHVFRLESDICVGEKAQCRSYRPYAGGQGANVAVTLANLGFDVSFAGAFGDEEGARLSRSAFAEAGVDLGMSTTISNCRHYTAAILAAGKERTIVMHRSSRLVMDGGMIPHNAAANFDAIYSDGHEQEASLLLAVGAAEAKVAFIVDIETVSEASARLAKIATHLIAPAGVLCALAGRADVESAIQLLSNEGPQAVVATLGADGSCGIEAASGILVKVPAAPCEVTDTTGAGDAFHAGYTAGLLEGSGLEQRMRFAARLAAAKCEIEGPRLSAMDCARFMA